MILLDGEPRPYRPGFLTWVVCGSIATVVAFFAYSYTSDGWISLASYLGAFGLSGYLWRRRSQGSPVNPARED